MAEPEVEPVEPLEDSVDEPADYWEKEQVAIQIAKFDDRPTNLSDIPMLVAVRCRPLWEKVRRAAAHGAKKIARPLTVCPPRLRVLRAHRRRRRVTTALCGYWKTR